MGKPCKICGELIVHKNRRWLICLDCLIDKLVDVDLEQFLDEFSAPVEKESITCPTCGKRHYSNEKCPWCAEKDEPPPQCWKKVI